MRSTNFLSALLLPFLLCLAIPVLAEQTTSVISEKAAVHSRPSSSAPIAAMLERGQSVVIDLMLTDSGGAWCLVRQPEHTSPAGYVLCNQLTRQAPQIYPPLRPVPSPTTPTPSANGDDARSVTATNAPNLGGLEPWAVQLALTDDQRRTVQQLYESSGLDACRDDLAATYRRYGVTDAYSLLQRMAKSAKNPYGDSFAAAVAIGA